MADNNQTRLFQAARETKWNLIHPEGYRYHSHGTPHLFYGILVYLYPSSDSIDVAPTQYEFEYRPYSEKIGSEENQPFIHLGKIRDNEFTIPVTNSQPTTLQIRARALYSISDQVDTLGNPIEFSSDWVYLTLWKDRIDGFWNSAVNQVHDGLSVTERLGHLYAPTMPAQGKGVPEIWGNRDENSQDIGGFQVFPSTYANGTAIAEGTFASSLSNEQQYRFNGSVWQLNDLYRANSGSLEGIL